MKTLRLASALSVAALALVALASCGVNDRPIEAGLDVSYVSGHLGTSWSCSAAKTSPPPGGGAALRDAAPCNGPGCGGGCEDGSIMIKLENTGNVTLIGLAVEKLLLDIKGGSKTALSISSVALENGKKFSGRLDPKEIVLIRIKFPAVPHDNRGTSATVEATVITAGGTEQRIITPELWLSPPVAT